MRQLAAAPFVLVDRTLVYAFARTLVGGRTPLLARLAALLRGGELSPAAAAYARRLTAVWALVFGAFAVATVLAVSGLAPAPVLYAATLGKGAICAALLVVEYGVRRVCLRQLPHPSLDEFLRRLRRGDYRAVLRGDG